MAYSDLVLADSPYIYLPFTSNSITTNLGSKTGMTATSAGITWGTSPVTGQTASPIFAASNSYIQYTVGTDNLFNSGTWTIEAWVKKGTISTWANIVHREEGSNKIAFRIDAPGSTYSERITCAIKNSTGEASIVGPVMDTNWHHVVVTSNISTGVVTMYVDGAQYSTANIARTQSFTSSTWRLGAYGTGTGNENFNGQMDEVALYKTVLSPSSVSVHYNQTAAVNAGYTAQVMTATAAAGDSMGVGNVQKFTVTDDALTINGDSSNYGNVVGNHAVGNTSKLWFKTPAVINPNGENVTSSKLYLYVTPSNVSARNLEVRRIDAAWDELTITDSNKPSTTLIRTFAVPATSSGNWVAIDIAGTEGGYGVMLQPSGTWSDNMSVSSYEASSTVSDPYVQYQLTPNTPVNVSAQPFTASAAMPPHSVAVGTGASPVINPMTANAAMGNATVSTGSNLSINAAPMYVSAAMGNATVSVVKHLEVVAEPMQAEAVMPNSGFAVPVTVTADALTANASFVDAAVSTQRGPKITAEPFKANAVWKQPSAVNGAPIIASEVDDKFFQRVYAVPPVRWYRLNDAGSTATDRMNASGPKGDYVGVQTGQFNAPDGRHSVYFNGSAYIRQNEGTSPEAGVPNNSLEFSFRTTKANTFLMVGADERAATNSNTFIGARELYLKDGRITQRTYSPTNTGGPLTNYTEFSGFRNLADGEWHTVVIRNIDTTGAGDAARDGIEIYIDGKFEIRRASTTHIWTGFPDFMGSRPTTMNAGTSSQFSLPALPTSQNFVGDMSEVAYFGRTLDEHEITRHYYDFMGWNPIEATSMDAFAFTPADSRGRGNQKRALYLWWTPEVDSYFVSGIGVGAGATDPRHNAMNFDPVLAGHGKTGIYDLEGYKVFGKPVSSLFGAGYRDNVYDTDTLIDLFSDVDIRDYDVIMFGDWPDEGYEFDYFADRIPMFQQKYERLLSQIRDANDLGIGLMVTQPRLAVDLGIVDRVEFVPTLKESKSLGGGQGNAGGLYDYGSAVKFPWNITTDAQLATGAIGGAGTGEAMNTDPAYLAYKAYFWDDQNFNNKFRVRATVEGLTDIPSWMIKDAAYHIDYDQWGDRVSALNLMDRTNGLVIGDEFIFHGTDVAGLDYEFGTNDGYRAGRPKGYYAVPMSNVKAGTVVTTFGASVWNNQSEVANPYKDYATTIVLDKGDSAGGRSVGGRIFVSFTEQPNQFRLALEADILPGSQWDDGSATWPNTYSPDTAAQRDWEWSQTRVSASNTALGGKVVETTVTMPDGSTVTTRANSGGGLIIGSYASLFGKAYLPRWDMTRRGMWWVGRGEKSVEGEVRVGAQPMTATAAIAEPKVTAQKDGGYKAQPMVALATMPKVKEDLTGDVDIHTLPLTASAEFTGFSRVVTAAPMLATATLVENFDMVHATGEQVVLTLHGVDATLFIKEEA